MHKRVAIGCGFTSEWCDFAKTVTKQSRRECIESRKNKTIITLAIHKGQKLSSEPIKARRNIPAVD